MKNSLKIMFALLIMGLIQSCGNAPSGEQVNAKEAVDTAEQPSASEATIYKVNTTNSSIEWVGSKLAGSSHTGTISLSGGELAISGGTIVSGSFDLDMNSITNTDQEAGQGKEKLEGHLKSGDFFEVEKFPTGKFEIASVSAVEGQPGVSHSITGNLTMKDITKSVTIPANISITETVLGAKTPSFMINRTDWDIKFNSGLLGTAKDKIINDDVALVINLVANPQ